MSTYPTNGLKWKCESCGTLTFSHRDECDNCTKPRFAPPPPPAPLSNDPVDELVHDWTPGDSAAFGPTPYYAEVRTRGNWSEAFGLDESHLADPFE